MSAMQVYVWEVRHSSGLARKYAYHQLELYLMVLSQLGKTYWTADLQHNLFVEALKVINGGRPGPDKEGAEPQSYFRSVQNVELPSAGSTELSQPENTLMQWSLEDFLPHFNPFMGLPMHGDEIR